MATIEGKCPVRIWRGFQSEICNRPVKRNGKCGLHAAADERRVARDAQWEEEWNQRQQQAQENRDLEAQIRELGGEWDGFSRQQLLELLQELAELRVSR